ncbi:acyltransferase, partial [Escherichia coli]|nr:acyltransferase [Escherichia coli]
MAGAALVLLAQRQDALPTGHPWVQWIGTASYSIYLWHWPIAVGARYFGLADQALWAVPAVALSLLLGGLSY